MGMIKGALAIAEEVLKTDVILQEMKTRERYPLFAAADKEIMRAVNKRERQMPNSSRDRTN